jgi:hypothetical protein
LKTGLDSICLGFFIFSSNKYSLIIQLTSFFSAVSSVVETFIVLWDEPVYSLLMSARVVCCQPPYLGYFQIIVILSAFAKLRKATI